MAIDKTVVLKPLCRLRSAVLVLTALFSLFLVESTQAGVVVVAHDVNTLGTAVAGANEARFATNVARLLTSGRPGKTLLLFEATAGDGSRDFGPVVLNALTSAGFSVTVTTNYATPFTAFDAIFVAESFPSVTFLNNDALIGYVDNGGSVYLAGGVGPSAASEAAGWNTFLNHFGLAFSSSYNGVNSIVVTGSDPIFAGVTSLNSGNGQDIINLGTDPRAQIVQTFLSHNVYAVVTISTCQSGQVIIAGIQPNIGGNSGQATIKLYGCGIASGAQVRLLGLEPEILGQNTTLPVVGVITTTFNLAGAAPGSRSVVVTNPDMSSAALSGGFTVEQGGAPDIAVSLVGRTVTRAGQEQAYFLTVVNRGNIDAPITRVWIAFPSYLIWDTLQQFASVVGQMAGYQFLAFDVFVPAGSSAAIPVGLQAPDSPIYAHQIFQVEAWKEPK